MKNKKPIVIAFILAGLVSVTFLSRAINTIMKKPTVRHDSPAVPPLKQDNIQYDTALVKRFTGLMKEIDYNQNHCFFSGTINMKDGRDSSENISGLEFLFRKQDSIIYYHIGGSEIFNNTRMNVLVDNANHKVVVSADRFQTSTPLSGLGNLVATLRSEHYRLSQQESAGRLKKISIVNEQHIACKEVTMTYDTVSNALQRIYTRTSDVTDPMNKQRERKLWIAFAKAGPEEQRNMPEIGDVLKNERGTLVLKGKYSAYQLIIL